MTSSHPDPHDDGKILPALVLAICGGCAPAQDHGAMRVNDWPEVTPAEVGLDAQRLNEIVTLIEVDPHDDFHAVVVARAGSLAYEQYFNGHGPRSILDIRSTTKSVTAALLGIAIQDGLIGGLDTPVVPLFPEYRPVAHADAAKQAITIEHLLTMTSGLAANADDPATPGYEDRMWEAQDWVRFVLDLPMAHAPGKVWWYASANTFLLGAAIEEAAGQTLAAYAEDRLFEPLGITRYDWVHTPNGRTVGQGNLSISARDMAKIGQLFLTDGRWQGAQVLPESWVRESLVGRYPVPWENYDEYGYGWYTHELIVDGRTFRYALASGNGGNKIYVLPAEQMVVAVQSAAYNRRHGHPRSLAVLRLVLSAIDESPQH